MKATLVSSREARRAARELGDAAVDANALAGRHRPQRAEDEDALGGRGVLVGVGLLDVEAAELAGRLVGAHDDALDRRRRAGDRAGGARCPGPSWMRCFGSPQKSLTVSASVVEPARPSASVMATGRLRAPTAASAGTATRKLKTLSPAVTSPLVPSSKNCWVAEPPIELRSAGDGEPGAGRADGRLDHDGQQRAARPRETTVGSADAVPVGESQTLRIEPVLRGAGRPRRSRRCSGRSRRSRRRDGARRWCCSASPSGRPPSSWSPDP